MTCGRVDIAPVVQVSVGKSTVIKLLARFYDPLSGAVSLDGVDLRRLTEVDLRRAIALNPLPAFKAYFARALGAHALTRVDADLAPTLVQAITEGTLLGAYRFLRHKGTGTKDDDRTEIATITMRGGVS